MVDAPINFPIPGSASEAASVGAFVNQHQPGPDAPINQVRLNVFEQPWWIEAAKGSRQFKEITVTKGGAVAGKLPYIIKRAAAGIRRGGAPDCSHLGGPIVDPTLSREEKSAVLVQLIEQLPRHITFSFERSALAPDEDLVREAFQKAGFMKTTRRTYTQRPDQLGIFFADAVDELGLKRVVAKSKKGDTPPPPLSDAEKSLRDAMERTRGQIRSAQKRLEIVPLTPHEFVAFYGDNLHAKGKTSSYPLETAEHLIAEGIKRDQVVVFAARRKLDGSANSGRIEGAVACSSDNERSYLWMHTLRKEIPGDKETSPDPGTIKLLIAHAIRDAHKRGLIFDADGIGDTSDTETLYRDRMRIPNLEERDVFTRSTPLASFVDSLVKPFAAKVMTLGARKDLRVVVNYLHGLVHHKEPTRNEGFSAATAEPNSIKL